MDENPDKNKSEVKRRNRRFRPSRSNSNTNHNQQDVNLAKLRDDFNRLRFIQQNPIGGSSRVTNKDPREERPARYISKQSGNSRYGAKQSGESWRTRNSSCSSNDFRSTRTGSQNRYATREEQNHIPSLFDVDATRSFRNPRRNTNEKRDNREKSWIGFKKLEEWSRMNENEVLKALISCKSKFEEFLDDELSGDKIVLVIRILAKLSQITFVENKTEIMNLVSKDKFIGYLKDFIMKLPLHTAEDRRWNKLFWNNIEEFFNNLTNILDLIIDTIPTRACEVLPKLLQVLTVYIPTFEKEHSVKLSEQIKAKLTRLSEKLELHKSKFERRKKDAQNHQVDDEDPPDDFRYLSVYPTSEEIVSPQRAFVRKHIIEGSYDSVEHYLDVQFRLLKEDFVAPLREGVCLYLNQLNSKNRSKISNIRIHSNVIFVTPQYNRDQVGVVVQFPVKQGNRRNFGQSKRFMYGSLVCFTKDNFASFLFGKVIDREVSALNNGQVTVGFDIEYNNYELGVPYIMIECSVFFEPYYHVLKALQNMPEEDFPMKNYLIDVNPSKERPTYLNENSSLIIENQETLLSVDESWPSANELSLDNTQYSAYKAALTQKFVVIQGPPGTGKTYLGLRIVKTLLQNKSYWYNNTPILVVCFTNHALDQFLEGLINETNKIVRVGGQSKNEQLQQFNLKNKRNLSSDRSTRNALFTWRQDLRDVMSEIKNLTAIQSKINEFKTVLHFMQFEKLDKKLQNSWFAKASYEEQSQWLLGGLTSQDRRNQYLNAEIAKLKEQNIDKANKDEGVATNDEINEIFPDQSALDIDDDNDDYETAIPKFNDYVISTETLLQEIGKINTKLLLMNEVPEEVQNQKYFNDKWRLENSLGDLQEKLYYLQMRLDQGQRIQVQKKPFNIDYDNPHIMHPDDRWQLYFYWLDLYKANLIRILLKLQEKHQKIYKNFLEIRNIDDTELMKSMLIVGMTTTGAARLQPTLQALKCRIVVVEEAAEVLESHITVSLTNYCDHLILIGDHQQLRPTTANYNMEKRYNLGISMFERMVRNKLQNNVLGVQHRMRPEIAKLICPNIYEKLENHESVYTFPPILGIDSCLYFIDHEEREFEYGDSSKANLHEAKFLIKLARYLIQNGYQPEDITILAAYSGQLFTLWNERRVYDFLLKDVKITILDNYQGEECKIILLSLVRNNTEGNVGFLKIENRVCVALSRAKEGFYIMGNMDLLRQNSEIWPKINATLKEQNAIGGFLTLRCQLHQDEIINARKPEDFDKAPEGGCSRICGALLNCMHTCKKTCHILDRVHEKTQCTSPCTKELCERHHVCPKMCFETCGNCMVLLKQTLRCGHEHELACHVDLSQVNCLTRVEAKLPCGHEVKDKPCYIDIEKYRCPFPCDSRVEPCGHSCRRNCHIKDDPDHLEYKCFKPCDRVRNGCSTETHICPKACHEDCPPCDTIIKKKRNNCSHLSDAPCNKNVDEIPCSKPCKKVLECGHHCKKKCCEPCGGCVVMVPKELKTCGHTVQTQCSQEPKKKNCDGRCPLKLRCGHMCKNKCKEDCTNVCKELVDYTKSVDCGHKFQVPCHLVSEVMPSNSYKLLRYCKEPCVAVLKCSHTCSGTCGSCAQGRIHTTCLERCGVPLICGHECPISCRETCQPCEKPCMFKCKHSRCTKQCGEQCTLCKEPCSRRCEHIACKAKCGAMCTVPPCNEPCSKLLPCNHPCVGFCGDPCPPLCRICDNEELTEILLGYEDEDDARYVLLDECKHVIESKGMDHFCKFVSDDPKDSRAIHYKRCPKCNTPLSSTQRYSDYIKQINQDVTKIKRKSYGTFKEVTVKREMLLHRIKLLESKIIIRAQPPVNTLIATLRMRERIRMGIQQVQETESKSHCLSGCSTIKKFLRECEAKLQKSRNNKRQPFNLLLGSTLEAKIQIVEKIVETFDAKKTEDHLELPQNVLEYIEMIMNFLVKQFQRITNQEINDFQKELQRLHRMKEFVMICKTSKSLLYVSQVKTLHDEIESLLFKTSKYEDNHDENVKYKLGELSKAVKSSVGITEIEKQQIVRAIGLQKGHWFQCPNGHYYVIGECGGAMVESVCNECKEKIGGTSHRLLSSNSHAGEMDGSRHAAWSQAANMENYEFV